MLALESELGDGFVGERLGPNNHVGRALHREMAQAQMDPATAQAFARAGERAELMDGHDHRARAVQHRALHPGCVKHVVCLAGAMRLDDLSACADRVAQRAQQAVGIPSDAARIGRGTAVEGDPHEDIDLARGFTASPRNTR
jgi:hypothetical protein